MNQSFRYETNGHWDLMLFFGTKERPVSPEEFREFWESLTLAEIHYYKQVSLL